MKEFLEVLRGSPPEQSSERYIAAWTEPDILEGKRVSAFVLILRTKGCSWAWDSGGCTMCGYVNDSSATAGEKELEAQLEKALSVYSGEPYVKIFTSGSFLDKKEVSPSFAERLIESFGADARRILVESRPEYVTADALRPLKKHVDELEVALGLESSSDRVRLRSINKGFTFDDYLKALDVVKSEGLISKTYLLLKPPFLTEKEALKDAMQSIKAVDGITETISLNPVNIQNRTLVDYLWRRGIYRPPWLWTLLEALKTPTESRLMSSPTAGGGNRGVHNCGRCDREIIERIEEFSMTQDRTLLDMDDCECRREWETFMDTEEFLGLTADIGRILNSGTEQSF